MRGPRRSLVPPRPNPGPEPWPETFPTGWWPLVPALIVAAWAARRLRSKARHTTSPATPPDLSPPGPTPDRSTRDRLIETSRAVREGLIATLGPAWGSRTTEEVAGDPSLRARIGDDRAARLAEFLGAVDLVKFAGTEPVGAESWLGWADEFLAELAGGATGRSSGDPPG